MADLPMIHTANSTTSKTPRGSVFWLLGRHLSPATTRAVAMTSTGTNGRRTAKSRIRVARGDPDLTGARNIFVQV